MKRILTTFVVGILGLASVVSPLSAQENVKTVKTSPLDEPLALLNKGRQVYQNVQNYSCTLVSQERIRGKLQEENVTQFKFRNQPFSVYMQWLAPQKLKGQEVCFVWGKNQNKMRVHAAGLAGVVGFVTIDPQDPRTREHTNHSIVEAGIWSLMERTRKDWESERQFNRTKATVADFTFNNRPCKRIEVTMLQRVAESYCYRTVLYLDSQTYLPVRVECYDWPQAGGPVGGELLEVYSYLNMQFNQQMTDQDFAK